MVLELDEVLVKKFGMSTARSSRFLTEILSFSEVCMADRVVDAPVRDAGDRKVLACAAACHADYIVTGDRDLLVLSQVGDTRVLTVREFLDVLGRS
jgi:putative PIN family toxin of toxin-antitoxin system